MELSTTYLGLKLHSPLVPSASPLSEEIDNIKRMEDEGASAIVLYSLFEEQLRLEDEYSYRHTSENTKSYAEALAYSPELERFHTGPDAYLTHICRAKEVTQIPIIASLNGTTSGGWIDYARLIEQAGADALELNIYYIPTDSSISGSQIEQNYLDIFHAVKSQVRIPVAVKLSPFFSNLANMARRLDEAGAGALVLFNRFYQPDLDLENLMVRPNLVLSTPHALRLPLRWIAILFGRIKADLAATSGIHTPNDVIKMLMAGASVTMLCSVLLRHGISQIRMIEQGVRQWMEEHEYDSVEQMRGRMSQKYCSNPTDFERAQYMRTLQSFRFGQPV